MYFYKRPLSIEDPEFNTLVRKFILQVVCEYTWVRVLHCSVVLLTFFGIRYLDLDIPKTYNLDCLDL